VKREGTVLQRWEASIAGGSMAKENSDRDRMNNRAGSLEVS